MLFNYSGREAHLVWYSQELFTAGLDNGYGREVLCRGFFLDSGAKIPMRELIPYLYRNTELLLRMTSQQIKDTLDTQFEDESSIWINLAGPLIASDQLFKKLWQDVLLDLDEKQKQRLVLEICEHDISDEIVSRRVSFLKQHEFSIAMDDFGAGYSNLQRLLQAPFDIIKLDLKLLNDVPTDLWAASFYHQIIKLCSSKGCIIVAEGVETQLQSDFVRWAGVDLIQGYLYSTPTEHRYSVCQQTTNT